MIFKVLASISGNSCKQGNKEQNQKCSGVQSKKREFQCLHKFSRHHGAGPQWLLYPCLLYVVCYDIRTVRPNLLFVVATLSIGSLPHIPGVSIYEKEMFASLHVYMNKKISVLLLIGNAFSDICPVVVNSPLFTMFVLCAFLSGHWSSFLCNDGSVPGWCSLFSIK